MSTVFNWEHIFGSCWKSASQRFFSHHVEFQTRNCFNILLTIVKNASQCNLTFGVEHMINYSFSANGKVGYISRHVGHIWSQPMAKENIFHLSVTRHTATWAFPCQVYLLIIILIIILALSQCIQWKDSYNRGNFISKYCQKIQNSCEEKLWEKNCKSQLISKLYSCIR